MDRVNLFRIVYEYGSKDILLAVARSIRTEQQRAKIDVRRLKNELMVYRHLMNKSFGSITSALVPLVLANEELEAAIEETTELFRLIRKSVTRQNRIGICFLCHMLFSGDAYEEEFASFTMLGSSKEDEIAFQKHKIELIMGKSTLENILMHTLEETAPENENLLRKLKEHEKMDSCSSQLESFLSYFERLMRYEVNPPRLESDFSLEAIAAMPQGQKGRDPLLGHYTIRERTGEWIAVETKRGEIIFKAQISQMSADKTGEVTAGDLIRRFGIDRLPPIWRSVVDEELNQEYFRTLLITVDREYREREIYPPQNQVFRALCEVDADSVRAVILGQDPYHGPRQANGLCFSVSDGVPAPPSLQNIFKELEQEYGTRRMNPDLSDWAKQGVLLLNAVLTVQAGNAASHAQRGWERFTDRIITELSKRERPLVFMLWGSYAIKKAQSVDKQRHLVLESVHPSPLSCHRGFFGNGHFLKANAFLSNQQIEVKWL